MNRLTPCRLTRTLRQCALAGLLLVTSLAVSAVPAGAQGGEVIEYYGVDAIGSIRVVFDTNGNVLARNDYVPFGESFTPTGALPSEQFTGQARDGEAGLDYFGARFYQPRHGRFSSVDPVFSSLIDPQQWNRYAYTRNSPGTFVDPNGLAPILPLPQPPTRVGPCSGCSVTVPGTPGMAQFITGILMPGGEGPGTLGCPRFPDCLPDDTAVSPIEPQPEQDGGGDALEVVEDTQDGRTGESEPDPKVPGVVGWKTGEPELTISKKQQERAGAVILGSAAVGTAMLAARGVAVAFTAAWNHPKRSDFVRFAPTVVSNQLIHGPGTPGATVVWAMKGGGPGSGLPFHYHVHQYKPRPSIQLVQSSGMVPVHSDNQEVGAAPVRRFVCIAHALVDVQTRRPLAQSTPRDSASIVTWWLEVLDRSPVREIGCDAAGRPVVYAPSASWRGLWTDSPVLLDPMDYELVSEGEFERRWQVARDNDTHSL